jgi:hypothetical protein
MARETILSYFGGANLYYYIVAIVVGRLYCSPRPQLEPNHCCLLYEHTHKLQEVFGNSLVYHREVQSHHYCSYSYVHNYMVLLLYAVVVI